MRSLILADIHANIDALDAVLRAAELLRIDCVLLLGDLIGYNAAPADSIARRASIAPVT